MLDVLPTAGQQVSHQLPPILLLLRTVPLLVHFIHVFVEFVRQDQVHRWQFVVTHHLSVDALLTWNRPIEALELLPDRLACGDLRHALFYLLPWDYCPKLSDLFAFRVGPSFAGFRRQALLASWGAHGRLLVDLHRPGSSGHVICANEFVNVSFVPGPTTFDSRV
jgi:hypothetical protein